MSCRAPAQRFWLHDWGKWSEPTVRHMVERYYEGKVEYDILVQARYCSRCNQYEERKAVTAS